MWKKRFQVKKEILQRVVFELDLLVDGWVPVRNGSKPIFLTNFEHNENFIHFFIFFDVSFISVCISNAAKNAFGQELHPSDHQLHSKKLFNLRRTDNNKIHDIPYISKIRIRMKNETECENFA